MTTERINLDGEQPGTTFADVPARRITGLAIPANGTANKGGRIWKFLRDSVTFGDRTPLLAFHDATRPVGRLTESRWSDRGLEVTFAVSRTPAGDDVLQLAHDGVLGLSVGIDVPTGGARQVGEEFHVSAARAAEVSLTPMPAFAGSTIDHVALSSDENGRTADMPDAPEVTPVNVTLDAEALGTAIAAAFTAANSQTTETAGPETVPVPNTTTTTVAEPAPYRFDGQRGAHGFIADMYDAAMHNDTEAKTRLDRFISETFVQQSNVTALNPAQQRPDLYVEPLRYADRPLANAISTGSIPDATPFIFPRFGTSGNLVNPHTEGVEPSLATLTATSATVTPGALSGKAELSREVWDARGNPAVDQLVWQEMLNASVEAAEARVAAKLDATTPGATYPVVGVDASAVDDLVNVLIGLQYERGGSRFNSVVANQGLYAALASAKDTSGRRLLPQVGPANADGIARAGWSALQLGSATAVPAWGLGSNSYLFPKASVWQWLSAPQKLTFDIQVKSVYVGFFQYSAEAVTRDADIRKITYAAS